MLGHTFNTHPGSLKLYLVFSLCLYKASRSTSGGSLGPSQTLPEHAHSPYMWLVIQISRNMLELLKPVWISHLPAFPLKTFLVAKLLSTALGNLNIKNLPLIIFNKSPQRKGSLQCVRSMSSQIRTVWCYLPGKHQTIQIMAVLWEWGFE